MFRASCLTRILAALLLIVLLTVAGVMIFQAGQAQGYAIGAASANQELAPAVPGQAPGVMPYFGFPGTTPGFPGYYPPYGFGFWPHFFVFSIGLFFFRLLFLFLIGGLFRRRFWDHYGHGPHPYPSQPGAPSTPPVHSSPTRKSRSQFVGYPN